MDKKRMTEHIKINLPLTEQDYLAGNGEGVWVLVDPKTKQAHDTDATGGGYVGILDNDSCLLSRPERRAADPVGTARHFSAGSQFLFVSLQTAQADAGGESAAPGKNRNVSDQE